MNTTKYTQTNEESFKQYLFRNRRNRIILCLAVSVMVIQFAIFKYLYPFASYIHGDSFSYLRAASENLTISTYPIGYSKFLRFFSVFAKPDIVFVAFQYLLIQCSILFLSFTIFYFYKPGKTVQVILLGFMILNPLVLHLANLVSSDGFFLAVSMCWFSLLFWIIFKPSNKIFICHALALFVAFTIRYNALIYPIISAVALLMSRSSMLKKAFAIGLSVTLCGWFVVMTMYQYKKLTGFWQFSPFSGWQLANNAMYAYRDVDPSLYTPVPPKFRALDSTIRNFYKSTRDHNLNPYEKAQASTFYMWSPGLPLMQYRDSLFKNTKDSASEFKKWATIAPFYKDYGMYIIKKYPFHYLLYFAGPNSRKYFAPPIEFLETFNSGRKTVTPVAINWFGYQSANVNTRMKSNKIWILEIYPILTGTVNLLMFFGLLYYIFLKGWTYNKVFNRMIILASILWILNAGFTIFASSAALRFQSFPILLNSTFALLIVDWLIQLFLVAKQKQNLHGPIESILVEKVIA